MKKGWEIPLRSWWEIKVLRHRWGEESYSYRCEMSSSETKSWIIEVIKLYFIVPTNEQNKIGLLQDLESQHKANVS